MKPLPNRLALYIGGAAALLGALAPLLADTDWESTAGILAGVGAITALIWKFLSGWQAYEQNPDAGFPELAGIDDGFDEDAAEPIPQEAQRAARAPIAPEGG